MIMAMNVGILRPQNYSGRASAMQSHSMSSPWIHPVQSSCTGRLYNIKPWHKTSKASSFVRLAVQAVETSNAHSGTPPQHSSTSDVTFIDPDTDLEHDAAPTSCVMASQATPSSAEKIGRTDVVKSAQAAITPVHELRHGEFLENRMVYRQKFVIRSYEVGADKATSIITIFSFFQEISLCHVHLMGIAGDGFGATKAMNLLGLIWVVAKMHVEVEEFPKWPDVIEIDSWIARAGKNGMRRDWIVRHYGTNEVVVRATSTWCMMDSTTRRVCKMPDAARAELDPFMLDDRFVFQQRDTLATRITKLDTLTAKYLSPPLKSCRADLDVNQHVSNLKYISWALQTVPEEHLETHNLTSITIEYRRECQSKNVVESLTSSKVFASGPVPAEGFWSVFLGSGLPCSEFTHLLRTQDSVQHEIVRARTTWRPKPSCAA